MCRVITSCHTFLYNTEVNFFQFFIHLLLFFMVFLSKIRDHFHQLIFLDFFVALEFNSKPFKFLVELFFSIPLSIFDFIVVFPFLKIWFCFYARNIRVNMTVLCHTQLTFRQVCA